MYGCCLETYTPTTLLEVAVDGPTLGLERQMVVAHLLNIQVLEPLLQAVDAMPLLLPMPHLQ